MSCSSSEESSRLSDTDRLPQPHNSNHPSSAPLREKLLTNSTYLAAEIPLKLGHWVSNLWQHSPPLLCSNDDEEKCIWLLGRRYDISPSDVKHMQQDILDAQSQPMFGNHTERETETGTTSGNGAAPSFNMSLLWPPDFYDDFTSRLWMTYRHNYPPIRPSSYTTDIGWGCMLRSGQSLLANALLIHFLGRDWRRKKSNEPCQEYRKIIQWFLDELSPRAPFSIHRIALLGKQLGKNIGEWFGPSTISQVILALVSDFPAARLAVYIATDGVVYRDDVRDVATGVRPRGEFGYCWHQRRTDDEEARAIYEGSTPKPSALPHHQPGPEPFRSVLILVAIRLGIDQLHPTYYPALKACFELPWFVGIAGGRPNSSLYFVGLQGDELVYMDPHFSRAALETKHVAEYSDADLDTYHCTIPRKIHISHLDPSMLLGFYCKTEQEFNAFCERINSIAATHTAIFTTEKRAPEYQEDVRSENDFGVVSDEEILEEEDEDEASASL